MEMLHRGGGSNMDMKQVAGAWIAAVVVFSLCLGVLSYLTGSSEAVDASTQTSYMAPGGAGLPRTWFEATGSLSSVPNADNGYDDGDWENTQPDFSDFDLAFDLNQ
jgi:hypothetical protein